MQEFKGLPIRGVHFDLKAHTLNVSAMCDIARKMARLGYNTILLEYQDKFPFTGALGCLAAPDALTAEQIKAFDALCKEIGMQIIPLIQCIGHMYYVLRYEAFAHLAEIGGQYEQPNALCPSHAGSLALVKEMTAQILALHPSCRYVHIGGDEARLSEGCTRCGDTPKHRLLASHYEKCAAFILDNGKRPIMWSDMLLAHPETLDALRGKVVVMDWDYWTTGKPGERARVWGQDVEHPEHWSELHKQLIRPYIYAIEPYVTNPFPYVKFLRDQGFEVLVAPATKCGGDPAYVPHFKHIDNCRAAVRAAACANALGVVVTSWAVRRAPWHLTENSLIAAAMCMKNPGASDEETAVAFAADNFGVACAELAAIPDILSHAASDADAVCGLTRMGLRHPQEDVGVVDDYEVRKRVFRQTWVGNDAIAPAYARLGAAAEQAQTLLDLAKPATDEQRNRVALWQWSIDTARLLSAYAPWLAEESIPAETAKAFLARFEALEQQGVALLAPIYTEASMASDTMSRIGIHTDYLKRFI